MNTPANFFGEVNDISTVSGIDDFNNDGIDDIAISVSGFDVLGTSLNIASILYGRDETFSPVVDIENLLNQESADDGFIIFGQGFKAIKSSGDIDGDGIGDACDTENLITSSTTIATSHTLVGKLIVPNGVTLIVPSGLSITLPLSEGLMVESGGNVIVVFGGNIFFN